MTSQILWLCFCEYRQIYVFMKTVSKNSRPNQAVFFLARDSKVDDVKVKREISLVVFPPLVYLSFIDVLSLLSLFYMA